MALKFLQTFCVSYSYLCISVTEYHREGGILEECLMMKVLNKRLS